MLADALRLAEITASKYWSIELDPRARAMADWRFERFGFGALVRPCDDIRRFDISMLGGEIPDLVVAGIPCQSLSMANSTRRGAKRLDGESGLIFDFVARVWLPILRANPNAKLLVENVPSAKSAVIEFSCALGLAPVCLYGGHFCAQDRVRLFYANFPIDPRPAVICADTFASIAQAADDPEVVKMPRYPVIINPKKDKIETDRSNRIGVIPTARTLGIIAAMQRDGGAKCDAAVMRLRGGDVAVFDPDHKTSAFRNASERPLISASNAVAAGDGKTPTILSNAYKVSGLIAARIDRSQHHRVWTGKSPARMAGSGGRLGVIAVKYQAKPRRVFRLWSGAKITLPRAVWCIDKGARLPTATETERLFGLPDGATAAPNASRSARIKLLGNGFIVPVVAHALRRIRETLPTLI